MNSVPRLGPALALLLVLCSCGPLGSPVGGASQQAGDGLRPAQDVPALEVGEQVFYRRVLANGLRAVAVQDAGETVSVFMVIAAGKRQETPETTGLAHLTEHAMYAGTPTTGPDEHDRRIVEMGGQSNAFTREDYTFFYDHELPPEKLRDVLAMEADRLRNLAFEESAVYLERERLHQEEHGSGGSPGPLSERVEAVVFQRHPYGVGLREEIGHTRAIELEIPQIRKFYDRYYQPDRTALVVAGAIEPKRALDLIEEAFAPLPPGQPQPEPPEEPEIEKPRSTELPSELLRDRLEWVWLVPPMGHPDRPTLDVLARLLSRRSAGEGVPIVASVGDRVDKDLFRLSATGSSAAEHLEEVLGGLRAGELQDSEVEEVKGLLAGRFSEQRLRARPYFSLAGTFGVYEVLGHAEDLTLYESAVRGLTTEDVVRAAIQYLDPQRRVTVRFVGTGAEPEPLPDHPDSLSRAALEAAEGGDLDRAVEAFTKLLALSTTKMGRVIALASRAQVRLRQRDYDGAIADCEVAMEMTDYPELRDLLDEAQALKAGMLRDAPTKSDTGDAPSGHPGAEDDALAAGKAELMARLETAKRELEEWRGLSFRRAVSVEFVEPLPDKLRGWYDAETEELVVSIGESGALSRGTLLHELAHLLQDQHWDLSALKEACQTRDAERALQGLIEGEAMLAVSELMDYDFERHAVLPEQGPIERDKFEKIYAYGTGLRLVRALRERDGWPSVDRAWRAPPRTTAELYHPERYPSTEVGVLEPSPVGGELIDSNRLGEFELRWLIAQEESTRSLVDGIASSLLTDGWRLVRLSDTEEREHWDLRFADEAAAIRFVEECRAATQREGWVVQRDGSDVRMQRRPRSQSALR